MNLFFIVIFLSFLDGFSTYRLMVFLLTYGSVVVHKHRYFSLVVEVTKISRMHGYSVVN